jgi:alpha-D-xyloside xylohydrolase
MKTCFIYVSLALALLASCNAGVRQTADGLIVRTGKGEARIVRLQVITDDVIRVVASPEETFAPEVNLIKDTAPLPVPPFTVTRRGDTVVLATATTQALVLTETGETLFAGKDGRIILREKKGGGKEFSPIEVEGTKGYTLRQVFENIEDEALYGLGQHQSDEFNYKGRNEELFQYNTKVSVPLIVSTRGYGVLWHNYSLSRFGDKRPYANLSEAFTLYGPDGKNPGALTATYYGDGKAAAPTTQRAESEIDYEVLTTVRNFPPRFPRNNAYAVWEGELEPNESGIHHFKLHYAGYTRVFIGGEEVIPERWRTAWNPNDYKIDYRMEKGTRYPLRIEWQPDGRISYLGLKVLSPLPEDEQNSLAFWSEMGDAIDYYFINGGTMDGVIGGYRAVTGKSPIMPKWAMGYWLSREHYRTQDEVLATVDEYRKREVPLDVIVQDWNYWPVDAWGSHEFDAKRYPDPAGMIRGVHDRKARFMISVWPKFYVTTQHYKELDALGAMYQQAVKDSIRDWIWPGYIGSFYDAYNPEARKLFWQQMNEHLYSLGVDAWWMDASEPNIQDNTDMEYRKLLCGPTALGPSAKFFNAYALVNADAIYNGQREVNPDSRVFLLTRSGFAGLQRYSTATWSGDIATRWEDMKAQISAGLNFALSGIPWWTMDIGGFCVENRYSAAKEGSEDLAEWRELNARWYQFGAFCPLFRSHGQYPYREIYNIAPEGAPAYRTMKYYTELRYRLIPYIYSLAARARFDDYTLMRALVMDYTADRATYDVGDQFLFGSAFMVCPVYTYKARSRDVYFPAGRWYDFYTGQSLEGGARRTVDAPYERIPLYVRAGAIVPTGDIVQSTADPQKDLTVYVYTGADGSFSLYEDNGLTYDYEQGDYATIPFAYTEADQTLVIGARQGAYPGMIPERDLTVVFINPEHPAGIPVTVRYTGDSLTVRPA